MENNETKRRFYVQTAMQDNIKYYYTSVSNVTLCNTTQISNLVRTTRFCNNLHQVPWIDYLFLNIQRQIPRVQLGQEQVQQFKSYTEMKMEWHNDVWTTQLVFCSVYNVRNHFRNQQKMSLACMDRDILQTRYITGLRSCFLQYNLTASIERAHDTLGNSECLETITNTPRKSRVCFTENQNSINHILL